MSPDRKAALAWLASLDLKVPKVKLDLLDQPDPPDHPAILGHQELLECQRLHLPR